jgi:peptidoglycan/LPS O-acetylase OafA/YrhL
MAIATLGVGSLVLNAGVIVVEVAVGRSPSTGDIAGVMNYLWAFAPGMILAELNARRPDLLPRLGRAPVLVAGVALLAVSTAIGPLVIDPVAAVGAVLVIGWLLVRPLSPRLVPAAVALGALSYSFYLWHEWLVPLVDRPTPTFAGGLLALGLSVAVATVVYLLVERPMIAVGRSVAALAEPDGRQSTPAGLPSR